MIVRPRRDWFARRCSWDLTLSGLFVRAIRSTSFHDVTMNGNRLLRFHTAVHFSGAIGLSDVPGSRRKRREPVLGAVLVTYFVLVR